MFILLNSKCRGLNKEFDFIIDDSVPLFAGGDAYRFYWCLYNVLVRSIEDVEQSKCIIHVSIAEGTSIENKALQIKLISSSKAHKDLATLLTYIKKEESINAELFNINAQLYERILNSFFEGNVSFKETESGDSVIAVNLIMTPKKYDAKTPQIEAKVLICAPPSLQASIVMDKIKQTGAEATLCDNKDELLKIVAKGEALDFILISDVFSTNPALIKVIQKKSKAKVVLLSTLNKVGKAYSNSEEQVVNLPLYQPKLLKLLAEKEVVTETKEKEFNVLVVDDDPSQQFILSHFLKRVGIVPELADNCDAAVDLIKNNSFDLVFMDCIMPGKDGFETTSLIREYEASLKHEGKLEKTVTIVGNTSLTASSEIDKCIQFGMDAVLNKPYKHEKILEILTRYS